MRTPFVVPVSATEQPEWYAPTRLTLCLTLPPCRSGDEPGDWGLVRNNKYYGLHGPGGMFASNESHPLRHILMPPHARPWYRQYYDSRQVAAFGDDARYFPLGSRPEFPDVDPGTYKAAPDRYGLLCTTLI